MRPQTVAATIAALALRLFLVLRFPFNDDGDSPIYDQLARNLQYHHVYGLWVAGRLQPVDVRVPAYPMFLDLTWATGRHHWPMPGAYAQVLVDLLACLLIAGIAARLAPRESRGRVWIAGLWLAALCPFIANYCTTELTEVLAVFFTALALCLLLWPGGVTMLPAMEAPKTMALTAFLAGVAAGCGALVRPETPLVILAAAAVMVWRCRRPVHWPILFRTGVLIACGTILPLAPWAARNLITLHEVQFLNPRNAELPGEYVVAGMNAWTGTWMWRMRDVFQVLWKVDGQPISLTDIPDSAFDSAAERARVAQLLDQYNHSYEVTMTPGVDAGFAQLARQRTARHPLRTYLQIPLLRMFGMWFTPRIELLGYTGALWPPATAWENDSVDFSVSAFLSIANIFLLILAAMGWWKVRHNPGAAFFIAFIVLRTVFFTQVESPEPRYMLECFPAVLALGAQVWISRTPRAARLPSTSPST
jgi:hypothetical protein